MSEQTFIRSSHKFSIWTDIWTLTWAEEICFHIDIKETILNIFRNTNPVLILMVNIFPQCSFIVFTFQFVLEAVESVTPVLDSDC